MNSLPILNIFQDLAKHCLGSGQAFSISSSLQNGTVFSTPGFNSFPRNTRIWSPPFPRKSKTPSQRRRDQRRWEQHQENKTKPAAGISQSSEQPLSEKPPPIVASRPVTPVMDSSPLTDAANSSPLDLTTTSGSSFPMEVDIPIPVIPRPLPDKAKDSEEISSILKDSMQPPPMLSPLTSPIQSTSAKAAKLDVQLLFCTKNEEEAAIYEKCLQRSNFTSKGPHPRNPHHFMVSVQLDQKQINDLKTVEGGLIKLRVESENKSYLPAKVIHCKECKHCVKN